MSGLSDVLGAGEAAKQLFIWAVLSQVVGDLMAPYFTALQNKVNTDHPVVPLSPADAAHAVVRSYLDRAAGERAAAKSGIDAATFAVMRDLAGDAPSPQQLVEALRRGLIERSGQGAGSTSFEQGVRETNLLDKWTDVVAGLAEQWPSPADALRAALQGQVSVAEGKALYQKWGGDPQWYQIMYDTEGSAPTPLEAVQMALRGIIPWSGRGPAETSYEQAFLEGPWRDKWQPAYQKAAYYYPTASEASEFLRYGVISKTEAAQILARRGVTGADAAAFIGYAEVNAIDDYRGLTEYAVLQMVAAGYTSEKDARVMLQGLHKGPGAIDQLLKYAGMQRAIIQLNNAVSRIGNLYQGRKIGVTTARKALVSLHLPAAEIDPIIADWDAVAGVNVKTLTESQIVDAWAYTVMDQAAATQELTNIGYTPFDAWVLLSNKNKGPLPHKPAQGPGTPLGAVTPGTT